MLRNGREIKMGEREGKRGRERELREEKARRPKIDKLASSQ